MNSHSYHGDEIAIIGMAGQFPGASNPTQYWQNLRDGVESISFFSEEELREAGVASTLLHRPDYIKAGILLDHAQDFDASFFNITPKDAQIMDPQHRLFLECAWEALESAGYDPKRYKGWIGVYAGVSTNSYLLNIYKDTQLLNSLDRAQLMIGNDKDFFSTRVSYKLGLKGPSLTIQTACSTSLVAVHTACQALLNGECDMALAGGSSVKNFQKAGYIYHTGGIASPDGHCRAFDAEANGTIAGDGTGIVVLKLLAQALTDGDYIHAVIKGSAINNDANVKIGFTAPSVEGQAEVIAQALTAAAVKVESISYIETHGTATHLGDPIEIAALTQAFQAQTSARGFCAIGSVKTNIGHLDIAAGIASVIKVALALQHQMLPPSLHFHTPNPAINFAESPFYVNGKLANWPARDYPRRAGISSFGIGGTNAHIIMEEAPERPPAVDEHAAQLLVLSARTPTALTNIQRNLIVCMADHPDFQMGDITYTLQSGRRAFAYRRAIVCTDRAQALVKLEEPISRLDAANETNRVVFLFPGQGVQYIDMFKELYEHNRIFSEQVDRCCKILQLWLGFDLRHIIYPEPEEREHARKHLSQTELAQPAIFVFEYALAIFWIEHGIKPAAMLGHSVGEYVAACLAGVFSLEDALKLLVIRGSLMQQLPTGAMLALRLTSEKTASLLNKQPMLSLAAINSPRQCVVAGEPQAIQAFTGILDQESIRYKYLSVSRAFHSHMVEPILAAFQAQINDIQLREPQIPYLSNVTGDWITPEEATNPQYWTTHIRQTVCFEQALTVLDREGYNLFLETGPGQTLSSLLKQGSYQTQGRQLLAPFANEDEGKNQVDTVSAALAAVGSLWEAGVEVNWSTVHNGQPRQRLPLPTYPFERLRYHLESTANTQEAIATGNEQKLNPDKWLYLAGWSQSVITLPQPAGNETNGTRTWLILNDSLGIGNRLQERLCQSGDEVILLERGQETATLRQIGTNHYILNPNQQANIAEFLTELARVGKLPQRCIHLWNLAKPAQAAQREATQEYGFYSLLYLFQSFLRDRLACQIWVITNNAQCVTGDEILHPEQALALGLCKTAPQESTQLRCQYIDIGRIADQESWQYTALIDHLLQECRQEAKGEIVAYRNARRWVQDFHRTDLNSQGTKQKLVFRDKGVYLLVGGLGEIGLTMASYLARRSKGARLLLVGRSTFPPREEWEKQASQDLFGPKIRQLLALEKLGAEPYILQADAADQAQMEDVFSWLSQQFAALHGVIYCAGISGKQTLTPVVDLSKERCEEQFRAKIHGLFVLEKLLMKQSLDFCLLQSSLVSILGGCGQAASTAANIFLDSFVQKHNQTSHFPWLSINWDTWALPEAQSEAPKNLGITYEEGWALFNSVLQMHTAGQVIVSTHDLILRLQQGLEKLPPVSEHIREANIQHYERSDLSSDYVAPRNETEQLLVEIWQEALGIKPVGISDNFFELGGDSFLILQIVSHPYTQVLQLTAQQFYEFQSIAELAEVIDDQ